MKKSAIIVTAVLAAAVLLVGLLVREPPPMRVTLPSFEQPYLKKGELVIRKHGTSDCDVLFLLTADKGRYYRWRNWRDTEKNEDGGLIFPEQFIIALYDSAGFDIATLKIPASALEHRDDVDGTTIVLGCTTLSHLPFSDAKKLHSFKVSFLYTYHAK